MAQLEGIRKIDYIVSHHAEQDHSGTILQVLKKYPDAKLISTPKAKGMLIDLLEIPETFFISVEDGETLSLGDKTLKFIYTPWVHWPETMVDIPGRRQDPVQLRFIRIPHCQRRSFRYGRGARL